MLLVGGIGAGKTTTGIAHLRAGSKLLSNDSPLLEEPTLAVLSYPGLLSAYDATLKRFPELHSLISPDGVARKVTFAAESIYPNVWFEHAPLAAIFLLHVANAPDHQITKLAPRDALRRLLSHAVERWDAEMIPAHLALLNRVIA